MNNLSLSSRRMIFAAAFALLPLAQVSAQELQINSSYTDMSGYLLDHGQSIPEASVDGGASGSNVAIINQFGNDNTAAVSQRGLANQSSQLQIGNQNTSSLTITGGFNNIATQQIGNNNNASLTVTGDHNFISRSQIGNNLSFSMSTNMSGRAFTVQQYGTGRR